MCSYLQYSLDNDAKSLYKQRIAPVENSLPSYEEVLNRICAEPRYATILSSSYIESSQAMNRLKCSVTGVYKASFPEYLSMPIAKGCPYYRILNYKYVALIHVVLIRLWEGQLMDLSLLCVRIGTNRQIWKEFGTTAKFPGL